MSDEALMAVPSAKAGLDDMALLFDYLEVYGVLDKVSAAVQPLPFVTASPSKLTLTFR
jgi:hypothetical protein